MNLRLFDLLKKKRTINGGGIIAKFSSANVSSSRNQLVTTFLDESDAEWLWMVDTDMVFAPNTLEALLVNANADKDSEHYAPIVGGLCFAVNDGKPEPTMYQLVKGDDGGHGNRSLHHVPQGRHVPGVGDGRGLPADSPQRVRGDA